LKNSIQFKSNLKKLGKFAEKLANYSTPNDIFLLKGELGSGKTTFSRLFITALHRQMKILPPTSIKSPTFPIMNSYDLKKYEIFHYDFYRIKNNYELTELGIFENFINNISIIEWPEILLEKNILQNYYLIQFKIDKIDIHIIEIMHSQKKLSINI